MSWPAGSPSSSALAVKSLSGKASTDTALWIVRKLSVVAASTSMRAGRSVRAHTMPQSVETSPDWTPCVTAGRSAARLRAGLAIPPTAPIAADDAAAASNRRRVSAEAKADPISERVPPCAGAVLSLPLPAGTRAAASRALARSRMMTAIGPPPSNRCGGSCLRRLTRARRLRDSRTTPAEAHLPPHSWSLAARIARRA